MLKRLKAASSVRGPLNSDSSFKNSALSNTKKSSERVEFSNRTNKKPNVASKNVASKNFVLNKKIVNDANVKNALKANDVLCVSCAKNVLITCHDKCLANYKLNAHLKVRKALFTTPRTVKSKTTHVVSKTRFSVKTIRSTSLDIILIVSKTKVAAITPLNTKNKVSSASKTIIVILQGSLGHNLLSVGEFCDDDLEVAFRSKTCYVQNLEGGDLLTGLGHNLLSVGEFCDDDLEVAFRSKTCYVQNLEGGDLLTEQKALPIVTTSEEQTSPNTMNEADELNQEDSVEFDSNTLLTPYDTPNYAEVESSTIALDLSNMHEFHQVQPSTHIWTKSHPLEQVIGDPSYNNPQFSSM
nr:integrase, catalytic region, zinc finger, CCHC-type, peptidase aspartic, catalytic [Tanacetum cinerariifolium]